MVTYDILITSTMQVKLLKIILFNHRLYAIFHFIFDKSTVRPSASIDQLTRTDFGEAILTEAIYPNLVQSSSFTSASSRFKKMKAIFHNRKTKIFEN